MFRYVNVGKYFLIAKNTHEKIRSKNTRVEWVALVHTTPEKIENGGFTLKRHGMFSVHPTLEKFKRSNYHSFWACLLWPVYKEGWLP